MMSWNGASWNFMPEGNPTSEYTENERPAQTQWQTMQDPIRDGGNSDSMQSYRHWKEINDPYGNFATQPDNQRARQHSAGHVGQPTNQVQHPNRDTFNGQFNFARPAFTQNEVFTQHQQRPFTQTSTRHSQSYNLEPEVRRQSDYHPTYPSSQERTRNTIDHQQYPVGPNTPAMPPNMPNYTAMPQNMSDPNVFPTFASDRKSDRSHFFRTDQLFAHELHPLTQHASRNFRDEEYSEPRPSPQYARGSHTQQVPRDGRQFNPRSQLTHDEPFRNEPTAQVNKSSSAPWHATVKEQRGIGSLQTLNSIKKSPQLSQLETSLRIITCSTEAIHLWKSTVGENVPLLFELFGTVANIECDETKMCMELKGRTVRIKCAFFSMDQEPPAIREGDCIRVIGRMDLGSDVLQCVSLRHATQDEKSFAFKFADSCNRLLHKFTVMKNEL